MKLPPRTKQRLTPAERQKIRDLGWTEHTVEGWWTGRQGNRIAFTDGQHHIVQVAA